MEYKNVLGKYVAIISNTDYFGDDMRNDIFYCLSNDPCASKKVAD